MEIEPTVAKSWADLTMHDYLDPELRPLVIAKYLTPQEEIEAGNDSMLLKNVSLLRNEEAELTRATYIFNNIIHCPKAQEFIYNSILPEYEKQEEYEKQGKTDLLLSVLNRSFISNTLFHKNANFLTFVLSKPQFFQRTGKLLNLSKIKDAKTIKQLGVWYGKNYNSLIEIHKDAQKVSRLIGWQMYPARTIAMKNSNGPVLACLKKRSWKVDDIAPVIPLLRALAASKVAACIAKAFLNSDSTPLKCFPNFPQDKINGSDIWPSILTYFGIKATMETRCHIASTPWNSFGNTLLHTIASKDIKKIPDLLSWEASYTARNNVGDLAYTYACLGANTEEELNIAAKIRPVSVGFAPFVESCPPALVDERPWGLTQHIRCYNLAAYKDNDKIPPRAWQSAVYFHNPNFFHHFHLNKNYSLEVIHDGLEGAIKGSNMEALKILASAYKNKPFHIVVASTGQNVRFLVRPLEETIVNFSVPQTSLFQKIKAFKALQDNFGVELKYVADLLLQCIRNNGDLECWEKITEAFPEAINTLSSNGSSVLNRALYGRQNLSVIKFLLSNVRDICAKDGNDEDAWKIMTSVLQVDEYRTQCIEAFKARCLQLYEQHPSISGSSSKKRKRQERR